MHALRSVSLPLRRAHDCGPSESSPTRRPQTDVNSPRRDACHPRCCIAKSGSAVEPEMTAASGSAHAARSSRSPGCRHADGGV
eukprot:3094333-Prymnesium_polylepis.2